MIVFLTCVMISCMFVGLAVPVVLIQVARNEDATPATACTPIASYTPFLNYVFPKPQIPLHNFAKEKHQVKLFNFHKG